MASKPSVVWYPAHSSNYTTANRPSSNPIKYVIIHVTQGSWSSALNWFQNPSANVSAHYTIRSSDGKIGQSVSDMNIAWHAGNWTYNQQGVGIEHEGYVSDPSWFTSAMYDASARLTAFLCDEYNIPVDRRHILGHNEVPGATHTDPGRYWNWSKFMDLVRRYSGGTQESSTYRQVVGNSSGRFSASSNWKRSTYSPDKHGTDYRYTNPQAVSDAAKFKFKIPRTGNYAVYARWPANSGYCSSTPIGIRTTSGMEWRRVDQRYNSGRWSLIGNFRLGAGDRNTVFISRWTKAKGYIIADAVRIVEL